jgi:hypothetical protein
MPAGLILVLWACSGSGASVSIHTNILRSVGLGLVTAALTYGSLRRWAATRALGICPAVCWFLLVAHPAWLVSAVDGDCGRLKFHTSVIATAIAGACVLAQWLPGIRPTLREWPAPEPPADNGDTRFYAGEPTRGAVVYAGQPAGADRPESGPHEEAGRRLLVGASRRLFAAILVGIFGYVQYVRYLRSGEFLQWCEPDWVLGPLYFLANTSPADDWIGYALLAVAVLSLLAVVVWPNRWTALVASLTALAWVAPGYIQPV